MSDKNYDYDDVNIFKAIVGNAMSGMRIMTASAAVFGVQGTAAAALQKIAEMRGTQYDNYFLDQMAKSDGAHLFNAITGKKHYDAYTGAYKSPWTGEVTNKAPSVMAGYWGDERIQNYSNSGTPFAQNVKAAILVPSMFAGGFGSLIVGSAVIYLAAPVASGYVAGAAVAANATSALALSNPKEYYLLPRAESPSVDKKSLSSTPTTDGNASPSLTPTMNGPKSIGEAVSALPLSVGIGNDLVAAMTAMPLLNPALSSVQKPIVVAEPSPATAAVAGPAPRLP